MQSKALPWLLILGGIVAAVYGFIQANDATESRPTEISVADLEADKPVDARWLKVTDGYLAWPLGVQLYNEKEDGSEGETFAWCVPLVSQSVVRQWQQTTLPADGKLDASQCRVMAYFKVADITPPGENDDALPAYTVIGSRSKSGVHRLAKSALTSQVRRMPWKNVIQIDHNVKPMQKTTALLIAVGGIVACLLGVGVIFWQKRQAGFVPAQPMHGTTDPLATPPPQTEQPSSPEDPAL